MGLRRERGIVVFIISAALCALLTAISSGGPGSSLQWPLELPAQLSGTLGEIRGYSLHGGIDIKTRGRNGFPVLAPQAGRVMRLVSKPGGYGNALFLAHPDGAQSVFGHLDSFEEKRHSLDSIASLARLLYQSDSIELSFREARLTFDRGSLLGFSGESGSGTPHLHYELRKDGELQNPLSFFSVKDDQAPVIDALYVCQEQDGTTVEELKVPVRSGFGGYRPERSDIEVQAQGRVFFKLSCHDAVCAQNSVAVHRIILTVDSRTVFEMRFDRLQPADFACGHFLYDISKSTIDGSVSYTYFLCRRAGNSFSGIREDAGGGYVLADSRKRKIAVTAYDLAGNESSIRFSITAKPAGLQRSGLILAVKGRNTRISSADGKLALIIKANSISNNTLMKIEELKSSEFFKIAGGFKPEGGDVIALYAVHPFDALFPHSVELSLAAPRDAFADIKRLSVYHFFEGKAPKPLPVRYNPAVNAFIARTRSCGYFALMRDASPPLISIPPTQEFIEDCRDYRKIRFYARDLLSQPAPHSIECLIDGEPYPAQYDPDRKWVEISVPRAALDGKSHHVILRVSDWAGNRAELRTILI